MADLRAAESLSEALAELARARVREDPVGYAEAFQRVLLAGPRRKGGREKDDHEAGESIGFDDSGMPHFDIAGDEEAGSKLIEDVVRRLNVPAQGLRMCLTDLLNLTPAVPLNQVWDKLKTKHPNPDPSLSPTNQTDPRNLPGFKPTVLRFKAEPPEGETTAAADGSHTPEALFVTHDLPQVLKGMKKDVTDVGSEIMYSLSACHRCLSQGRFVPRHGHRYHADHLRCPDQGALVRGRPCGDSVPDPPRAPPRYRPSLTPLACDWEESDKLAH